ncbi:MAG: type II toxin-antitoxin system prevent-host-death family antitoxin [Aeromicrobium sp.]|uniref:type II toxin-antitoxin system Phd/YefM family antitoxin n=1 Tax=Aeromicrobium sp. TaxID=1871063 RepID=UPI0039E66551
MSEAVVYSVYEAKTQLSRLLVEAEQGRPVTIARHGKPVARLVPYIEERPRRVPGIWKGKVEIGDDFDELDEQEWADWSEGDVFPSGAPA